MPDPADPASPGALRRRGRLHEAWTGVPLVLLTWSALSIALWTQLQSQPHLAAATMALHLLGMFFANAYRTAWRAGLWGWQTLAYLTTASIWCAIAWLHLQDAAERVIYLGGAAFTRPAQPQLQTAAGLLLILTAVLGLHLVFLGTGSRPPATRHTAPSSRSPSEPTS